VIGLCSQLILPCSDCSTSFLFVAGRNSQLYFLFILFFATDIPTLSALQFVTFVLHLCQDVLLVGFFFLPHICVVCCPLRCVYMDLDIFYFPFFCFGSLLAVEKPEGRSQFFLCRVLGYVFFVLDFLDLISVLRYFCLLVIQFMNVCRV